MSLCEKCENGKLFILGKEVDFSSIPWVHHAKFEGVALKHIITAKDTNGDYSYHLVKIEPQKAIGLHIHETQIETHEVMEGYGICNTMGQEVVYDVGTVAIMPIGVEHEILAGDEGMFLLAKFFPAFC